MSRVRADRFASLYVIGPARRLIAPRNGAQIPILMYHSISKPSGGKVHPYFETNTAPEIFERQMKYLYDAGYSTLSPADVVAHLNSGTGDTSKKVVITFDDGFQDFYTQAFPVLQKYGLSATVYLPTAFIDTGTKPFLGKSCLNWSEVRELHKMGVAFGSHTVTHPTLKFMTEVDLEHEVCASKEAIENELGVSIDSFAYPYAFPEHDAAFAHRLRDLLKSAGYNSGVSTVIGSNQTL
jgi:peptidoglycan/xylan/chitin deacetylase (PgdA/CDA1 family)